MILTRLQKRRRVRLLFLATASVLAAVILTPETVDLPDFKLPLVAEVRAAE